MEKYGGDIIYLHATAGGLPPATGGSVPVGQPKTALPLHPAPFTDSSIAPFSRGDHSTNIPRFQASILVHYTQPCITRLRKC